MKALLSVLLLLVLSSGPALAAPANSVNDILHVLDGQPIDTAALDRARAVLARPLPPVEGAALANAHWERSRAAAELGLVGLQIDELRRVIALGGAPAPYRAWRELGQAEFLGGNFRRAVEAREKALSLIPDDKMGRRISEHAGLAEMYRRMGDFEKARRHTKDAEDILFILKRSPAWSDFQYSWLMSVEDALGRVELSAGRYLEAEARFRKALELLSMDMEANVYRLARGMETPSRLQLETYRDILEAFLAQALVKQARLYEAEILVRQTAYRVVQRAGQENIFTNFALQQLVFVLGERTQLETALRLADRVLANYQRMGVPSTAYFAVRSRNMRAGLLAGLGRWQESLVEFEAVRAALAADPQLIETLGAPNPDLVRALLAVGRNQEGLQEAVKLHRQLQAQLGSGAYETAEALGYLGAAQSVAGLEKEALRDLREAVAVLAPAGAVEIDRSGRRFQRLSYIIETYLQLLARIRGTPLERAAGVDAAAEAFLVADILRGRTVQQAMAASAARAAAGTPELASLARDEQDARQERNALYAILADLVSRPADQLLPGVVEQMRRRVAALDERAKELSAAISLRFPDYADLAAACPVSMQAVRQVLRSGEALLSVYAGSQETYVWALQPGRDAAFAAVPLGRAEVDAMVARLRSALDPGDVDYGRIPAFDGELAHRLYKTLLAPVGAGWQGADHLIVTAGGHLGSLPLALLTTETPAPAPMKAGAPLFAEYMEWPWLTRKVAISQLPAAASLVTLRRMKPGAADRRPFIGFGDPLFSLAKAGNAPVGRAQRAVDRPRRALGPAMADDTDYSRIAPLPDTAEEILSLAGALKADPEQDVFLGARASREQVVSTDLQSRKVVAFATHGLLAGEFPGVEQPSLALANPGNGGHGLLTLDDILGLKLDADWVILSACNTASGEGQGAEAISGLGRGFFYAGSRALLVTHWPVESASAKRLVVGVFEALAENGKLTRAQALNASMLKVMAAQGEAGGIRFSYAHPLFWAPYALVGDGGR